VHVAVVVGRTGLVGRRASCPALLDRELAPVRVDLHLSVAGEDVGDDVGGLRADDLGAFRLGVVERPDLAAVLIDDLGDELARHLDAAVGDRAVARDHVDRVRLERSDAHRANGHGRAWEDEPEVLGALEHVIEAHDQRRLDRRDVERELEGAAQADRATLELVGLGRRVAAAEVRDDVHEHRAGSQRLVVDADGVVDRLDRRPRLPPAVGQDVELGLELLGALRRIAGAPDVGQDLARPVVEHR
jgi:hypothetical protein